MMQLLRIFQTVIMLLLVSCASKIEKEELIGRYVWNDGRIDTLEIRADGTYEYWTIKPGRKIANSGAWKFNPTMNEVEFTTENFPFLKSHDPNGSWFSRIRSKDNEVHIMYEIDSKSYLRRIADLKTSANK